MEVRECPTPPAHKFIKNSYLDSKLMLRWMCSLCYVNPRTAGGLSHLRTAGAGADTCPPPRELEN